MITKSELMSGLNMFKDKLFINISVDGGANCDDFTGATSIAGGLSGLVPAPQAGDESKFLRGDGSWSTVESGGASIAVFTGATSITGGLSGLVPAPQAGDESKFLRGDGSWATVKSGSSGGMILDTVPATVDGGLWYEKTGSVPVLWLHKGNYDYSFNYSGLRYLGSNEYLKCYLPFDSSTTADACGNFWSIVGAPCIDPRIKKFGCGSIYMPPQSYIYTQNEFSVNNPTWTFDFWMFNVASLNTAFQFGSYRALGSRTGFYHNGTDLELLGANGIWIVDKNVTSAFNSSIDNWAHFAATRKDDVFRFFVNGQLIAEAQLTQSIATEGNYFMLGCSNGSPHQGSCYLDSVRLFDGVALWTSDFTPPTAADYA